MKRGLLAVLFVAVLGGMVHSGDGWLEVYCIDVGQGDATLIVGPDGTTVLVDAGRSSSAAENIAGLMDELGISQLDYTLVTHYDQDHVAGLCDVLEQTGEPDIAAFDRGGDRRASASSAQPAFFAEYMSCTGDKRTRIEPGDTIELGGATIKVLAVGDADYTDARATSDYTELLDGTRIECAEHENEKSIAMLITFGGFDMLLAGDLTGRYDPPLNCSSDGLNVEMPVGQLIVGEPLQRGVDVFHANHHGSGATSNTAGFISLIKPEVVVISVGDSPSCGAGFNTYGHPGQSTLDALYAAGVEKIYQTEEGGCRWTNDPEPCTPLPDETCPRDYHGMPHEFLYDQHVVIRTDGMEYMVKNASGQWDYYEVDDPAGDDDDDDDTDDDIDDDADDDADGDADDDTDDDDDSGDDDADDDSGGNDGCGWL